MVVDLFFFRLFVGQKLSEEEVDEMIKEADANNDGKIDYKEFGKMMVSLGGSDIDVDYSFLISLFIRVTPNKSFFFLLFKTKTNNK